MKGATQCARRLKQFLRTLRKSYDKAEKPVSSDPVGELMLGIFTRNLSEARGRECKKCLTELVVDYNDLRVIPALEMSEIVPSVAEARIKCEDLSRALNRIFAFEHAITLEHLRKKSRKDVVTYLARIDGLDAYTCARIRLFGLEQHAAPLDEAMWAFSIERGIVDAKCPLEDAQQFLERQLDEKEGGAFFASLRKAAWNEVGAAVRRGKVRRIASIPPDRTTQNMLAQVAAGGTTTAPETKTAPVPEVAAKSEPAPKAAAASKKKKTAPKAAASRPARVRKAASATRKPAKRKATPKPRGRAGTRPAKSARTKTTGRARRASTRAKSA